MLGGSVSATEKARVSPSGRATNYATTNRNPYKSGRNGHLVG